MPLQKRGLNLNRDRRELKPHGTPDFPCAGYLAYLSTRTEDDIEWHWHEEIEVLFVQEGGLRLYIPGRTVPLAAGDGAIITSNVLHMAQAIHHCELRSLVFRKELISGGDDTIFAKQYIQPVMDCPSLRFVPLRKQTDRDILDAISTAFLVMERGGVGYEFMVRNHLSLMWLGFYRANRSLLGQEGAQFSSVRTDAVRMRSMLAYIHSHYAESISLDDIAQTANIGQRECLRCFQRTIGISPRQYLLKYRVSEAAHLLRTTQLPIAEIAIQCGFDSPSNFTQTFRKFYTVTPREYRQSD